MIFKVECEVESTTPLLKELEIECGDKIVVLKPKNNLLSSILIKKRIENIEKFRAEIVTEAPGKHLIKMHADQEIVDDIFNDFRELESLLPLDYGVKKIYWEFTNKAPKIEYEPESEEERKLLKVLGYHFTKDYLENKRPIDPNRIKHIFENKHKLAELIVPLAFLREGTNYFHDFRYVYSFYNFYFIIEDLYANGKFDENGFLKECGQSTELLHFVKDAYEKLGQMHKQKIKSLLDERSFSENPIDLLKLIFRIRGNLHHFGSKSTRAHGTPFNQKEFESPAIFLMSIVLPLLILKINQTLKAA